MTKRFWHDSTTGFLRLLHLTRTHMASNGRDKVYALLGHPCASRIHVDIDYTGLVSKTYRDVAVALLQRSHSKNPLQVLSAVFSDPHSRGHTRHLGLPSWAPDWHTTSKTACLALDGKSCYSAGRHSRPSFQLHNNDAILAAKGIIFDSAVSQSHYLRNRSFLPDSTHDVDYNYPSPIVDIWNEFCSSNERNLYPTGTPRWKAYCDTLTAENLLWFSRGQEHPHVPHDNLEASLGLLWGRCARTGIASLVPATLDPSHSANALSATTDEGKAILFFQEQAATVCKYRRFFVTRNGYYGLGPHSMLPRDKVVVLFGADVPFILRQAGDRWKLVGECYLNGIMHGEAIDMWREGKLEATIFQIE